MALGLAVESPAEISPSGTFVAALIYSSLVGTGFAWLLFFGLVRAGEASRVAAYIFFVPLVAVLIEALFLGEALRASLIVGAVLVVTGIYLVNRQPAVSGQPSAKSNDSQAGG